MFRPLNTGVVFPQVYAIRANTWKWCFATETCQVLAGSNRLKLTPVELVERFILLARSVKDTGHYDYTDAKEVPVCVDDTARRVFYYATEHGQTIGTHDTRNVTYVDWEKTFWPKGWVDEVFAAIDLGAARVIEVAGNLFGVRHDNTTFPIRR